MIKRLLLSSLLFCGIQVYAQNNTPVKAKTDTTKSQVNDSIVQSAQMDMPDFAVSADALEDEAQTQNVSGLLTASKDVFTSTAFYNLSAAHYRIRGYGSENSNTYINGVNMMNPESGWGMWYLWSGLNDVIHYSETRTGISPSHYGFSGIGGFSAYDLRASNYGAGGHVSYAYTNRSYNHRVMATYSTGMMNNGYALTVSGSRRYSDEGYIDGTYYNGGSYFLSAEKKINSHQSIGLVTLGAPTIQGKQGISTQEADSLAGSNYYNPYWGYQNGKKRNAKVRNGFEPLTMLTDYWKIDSTTNVKTTATYLFGRDGYTSLNWNDAPDPRPDYYKYLPSYYAESNPAYAAELANAWKTDPSARQINWDALYNANYNNLYTVQNVDGTGSSFTGLRSKYIVEERRKDPTMFNFNSTYTKQANSKMFITAGINVNSYKSHNFKVVNDLLGGQYWLDVDQFAQQTSSADSNVAQSDLQHINHIVKKGDVFGYNYTLTTNKYEGFGQVQYTTEKANMYAALDLSNTSFWRDGKFQDGLFPDNSLGKSAVKSFFNYGIKAGIVYKITGRHQVTANVAYLTRAPFTEDAFISPQTRNDMAANLSNEIIMSGDLNYIVHYPKIDARATVYYTQDDNATWMRSFYHDVYRSYVNYLMTGVNKLYEGTEIGVQYNATSTISFTGAFGSGQFVYNSRPKATVTVDNSAAVLAQDKTIYFKNYRIGGMPQTAASGGFKYNSPKYWFIGANFNYFADNYLDPNPDRRTEEAVANYMTNDPEWNQMLDQTKLKNAYTIDLYGGKSWKIHDKPYYIRFIGSIDNLLNNKSFVIGGYEQLRYNPANIGEFPPKLAYMYGLTYSASLALKFN